MKPHLYNSPHYIELSRILWLRHEEADLEKDSIQDMYIAATLSI